MAVVTNYKQYNKRDRRAVLETDFSKGMMSTDGVVDEGYVKSLVNFTYEKDNGALRPRPSLRPFHIIFPEIPEEYDSHSPIYDPNLSIKASKECVENGTTYYQIVLGIIEDYGTRKGSLVFVTSEKPYTYTDVELSEEYTYDLRLSESAYSDVITGYFYTADVPSIHNIPLVQDTLNRVEFPVGTFAFGNGFYFFGEDENHVTHFYKTEFDNSALPYRYKPVKIEPKVPSVSEAVTYGYNMLLGAEAYTFSNKHTATLMQFEGILPYEVGTGQTKLMMTPKKNQPIDLVCYYDAPSNVTYDIVWESRETTASDWTQLKKETITFGDDTTLILENFHAQDTEIMIRVSAYRQGSLDVEKAMVVGFDFTVENYGAANTLQQKSYDLSTATGMESWNGRIVLWGLPEDPTILFISDYNEPSYFPYPNNITVFDEPIIYAVEFMDSLVVFTTNKIYQVTLADDGNSWKTTVLQSHLSVNPWDKHLIQTVRNMLYFKSGNYYYMMVPKAQSLTGELTLAPITTPITSFFDNFSVNVQNILRETYDYTGDYELITFYNFLDYEDIHNLYLFSFNNTGALIHFDVIYNTVDRTWKVWVYESAHILFPFKHNATELGLLATTSLIDVDYRWQQSASEEAYSSSASESASNTYINHDGVMATFEGDAHRIIQIMCWDKLSARGGYIPTGTKLLYDPNEAASTTNLETVTVAPGAAAVVDGDTVVFGDPYADAYGSTVVLLSTVDYYAGFDVRDIKAVLQDIYNNSSRYFVFKNYQFIDTGYRNDELQAKKRYRELQLQINNLDKKDMKFGMEFILDGAPLKIHYKYDTTQVIDEFDPNYGVVYVDSTPYLETDLADIDLANQWTIDQSLSPEVSLWKIRVAIAGKGAAPRFKLFSRNEKLFELLGINWVSKLMHMR